MFIGIVESDWKKNNVVFFNGLCSVDLYYRIFPISEIVKRAWPLGPVTLPPIVLSIGPDDLYTIMLKENPNL